MQEGLRGNVSHQCRLPSLATKCRFGRRRADRGRNEEVTGEPDGGDIHAGDQQGAPERTMPFPIRPTHAYTEVPVGAEIPLRKGPGLPRSEPDVEIRLE